MSATSYVNNNADLQDALKRMQSNPSSEEAKYWKKRAGDNLTAESFGAAHAEETNQLITGEYQEKHGAGSTEITAGTETDFAKEHREKLQEAGVEDTSKINQRKAQEARNEVSSGSGVSTPTPTDIQHYPGLVDTSKPFGYTEGLLSKIRSASPFVSGPRSGGKMDYTTYGGSVKDNTDYVNTYPDLKRAWTEIQNNPNSETALYWLPRMGVTDSSQITIDRFGMAHQAENAKLGSNTYVGDTDVRPGGSRWGEWSEGKDKFGQRDPTSDYWKDNILDPNDPGGSTAGTGGKTGGSGVLGGAGATGLGSLYGLGGGRYRGGEYLSTPYQRPSPRDISGVMPDAGLLQTPAQRSLVSQGGLLYQPEAMGGLIPYTQRSGLTSGYTPPGSGYTPPGGSTTPPPPVVTPPVVTPPGTGEVDWAGVPVRGYGYTGMEGLTDVNGQPLALRQRDLNTDPYSSFEDFNQRMNEVYYPGRMEAAQAAGASGLGYFTPAGSAFREAVSPYSATAQDWQQQFGTGANQAGLDEGVDRPFVIPTAERFAEIQDTWGAGDIFGISAADQIAELGLLK